MLSLVCNNISSLHSAGIFKRSSCCFVVESLFCQNFVFTSGKILTWMAQAGTYSPDPKAKHGWLWLVFE